MLPVSAWPPGPPGDQLSPFGRPRTVNLAHHRHGFVLPKGAWVVQTGSNRVIMFRPPVRAHNPARPPGTGFLPGQAPTAAPLPPPAPPLPPPRGKPVWLVDAQIRRYGPPEVQLKARNRGPATIDPNGQSIAKTAKMLGVQCAPPPLCPPPPPPFPKAFPRHDDYLEAWRAWQRQVGRTDPPIRPLPGRRPPNWFGWAFQRAPGTVLIDMSSGGTVLADGQNVVIAGAGFANITQAFSV
jgi:hypothetical protein